MTKQELQVELSTPGDDQQPDADAVVADAHHHAEELIARPSGA
ncbi:hypothetical protein ACPA9J_08285 [Pseudomonas aeruginosa]